MATQTIERVVHARETTTRDQMKRKFTNSGVFAILLVLTILWLIPLAWSLDTALKPESETTIIPLTWISSHFTLQAFASTLSSSDLPRWYFNSILTSVVVSLATVVLASMAAFAFSRIPFRGRGILFWIILAGIMVPGQILIIPLFAQMESVHLVDTYWGVILPQVASPIAVFIFKQYFDGIPHELEEA